MLAIYREAEVYVIFIYILHARELGKYLISGCKAANM